MTTTTIERVGVQERTRDVCADLQAAHLEAAAIVAELDLGDETSWRQANGLVADLTAACYDITAAVSGEPPPVPAIGVPPIVRVRELASAQRRLFAVLDRHPQGAQALVETAVGHVRVLGQMLRHVALSTHRWHSRRSDRADLGGGAWR